MSYLIQRALSGGELDPVLWARSDITKYMTGLRTLRNGYVRRNGGVQNRGGGTKIQNTKSNAKIRLVPFIFNQSTTYMIELGDHYMRFYQNGIPMPIPSASAYNAGTAYSMSQLVTSGGSTYVCIKSYNGANFALDATNPAWGLNGLLYSSPFPTSTGDTPSTHGQQWYALSGGVYEIPTPWAIADIPNLKFDQSKNDIVFTHPSYPIMRLTRKPSFYSAGVDAWQLFAVQTGSYFLTQTPLAHNDQGDSNTFSPGPSAVKTYAIVPEAANGDVYAGLYYAGASAELVGGNLTTTKTVASGSTKVTLEWTAVTNAISYNIYKMNINGVFGFVGSTSNVQFIDDGITPDFSNAWLLDNTELFGWSQFSIAQAPWTKSNVFPSACAFYQQRAFYGNTNNKPTTVWGSQTALFDNFNINTPALDTDSLSLDMAGSQDVIQHLLSIGTLLVFTYGSINSVNGDSAGAISPSAINPHRETIHGAGSLRPLIVGEFALYLQSQGSIIRDLGFNFQVDGYRGDDLTIFATHLFDNYTLVDWAYQNTPNSIVWAVRSDGSLLSLTYIREQQVIAWARHDSPAGGGVYENVACIPEGNQVSVYVVVKRVINGSTVRFIERLYNQQFSDVRNYIGMDCATTIDGRNTTTDTVTLSGGTNWNETELLTATLNHNNFLTFTAGMATNNDRLFIYDSNGNLYRFRITVYSSATVVQGFLDRQLPVSLQSAATSSWSHAINVVTGLSYLEAQKVSVFGDGYVVGSPNNTAYPTYTVSSGQITLDKHYAVLQVGLPFITDIETLDIDTPGAIENLGGEFKQVGEVTVYMVNSRPVFVGEQNPDSDSANANADPLYRLTEQKVRQNENYDSPITLMTGKFTQNIQPDWDQNGHVFIRNVDPTPMIVSAISPNGLFPIRGAS